MLCSLGEGGGGGANNFQKDVEEPFPADQVERFVVVDEGNVEGFLLLSALFLYLTEGEDHVHCRTFCSEATLRLWIDAFGQRLETQEHDAGVEFAYDVQEGDTPVVIFSLLSPLFLYRVAILASRMSCGTAPSLRH